MTFAAANAMYINVLMATNAARTANRSECNKVSGNMIPAGTCALFGINIGHPTIAGLSANV